MKKYTILIVENDFLNAQWIEKILTDLGHHVIANLNNPKDAIGILHKYTIDFAFIDTALSSFHLNNALKSIPTIYITSIEQSHSIVDTHPLCSYITKPFREHSIKSTLIGAINRLHPNPRHALMHDTIDLGRGYYYSLNQYRLITHDGITITLSKILNKLLYTLSLNLNETLTHKRLIELVWRDKKVSGSTVRDTIKRLRKELPTLNIQTISGVGYRLKNQ